MSRYIDADALEYDTEWSEYHDGFTAYSQMAIDTAPSIDIVRCGECKYWHDHITSSWCSRGAELRPQESGWIKRNADDFCSYGEREGELPNCKVCKNRNKTEFMCNACAENDFYKYEPQTEDMQDWKDRMWAEAVVTEPNSSEKLNNSKVSEKPTDSERSSE